MRESVKSAWDGHILELSDAAGSDLQAGPRTAEDS